jgi:hypothetical protein
MNGCESVELVQSRLKKAKRAFTTRRVPDEDLMMVVSGDITPRSGDLVLARVDQLGHHSKLELTDGRRAQMHVGDEIIVCFGNRYAPDQFEAVVGDTLESCDLVAAGGIAGTVRASHDRTKRPTKITPLGLIANHHRQPLNLQAYALEAIKSDNDSLPVVAVVGTAMNSGKTLTAASLIKGLERAGFRPGAVKVTGTGSGGDLWQMLDAGAVAALDFTDAGYASSYLLNPFDIQGVWRTLTGHLDTRGADVAVVEVADGIFQKENKTLIGSGFFRHACDAVVFCSADSVGAVAGAQWLTSLDLPLKAVTGLATRAPLFMDEIRSWTDVPVIETATLADPAIGERVWGNLVTHIERSAAGRLDERLDTIEARLAG